MKGKLAHFRKYYANNTAFSFSIPPRTTLMGIVASVMGWDKDKYYEKLSSDNVHFSIRVLSPIKKSFHRLNLLSIKHIGDLSRKLDSDFRGKGEHIQTPFEIVSGLDIRNEDVEYQIFIKPSKTGIKVFEEIKLHFLNSSPVFNTSFGIANFNAAIFDILILRNYSLKKIIDNFVTLHSEVPTKNILAINFNNEITDYNFIEEDLFPAEFIGNENRELKKMNRLLFSTTNFPIEVKLSSKFYSIQTEDENINIVFIDE